MLEENQEILVRWSKNSKEHYESLGYECNNIKEPILVKAEDLYPGSHVKVKVICDFSGKHYEKNYADYLKQHEGGDCCKEYLQIKAEIMKKEKFGEDYIENLRKAFKEKYNVDNPMQVQEFREKVENTVLEKYGVKTVLLVPENFEKALENSWTEEAREKRKNTNKEIYGTEWGLASPEIREKIVDSYYKNCTGKTSKPQILLYNLLLNEYGNCELNYPCGQLLLDCMIVIDEVKIDVEYDGRYWHSDAQKDRRRDEFVKSQGYKVLRIVGKHKLPELPEIKNAIDSLLNSDKKYAKISTQE